MSRSPPRIPPSYGAPCLAIDLTSRMLDGARTTSSRSSWEFLRRHGIRRALVGLITVPPAVASITRRARRRGTIRAVGGAAAALLLSVYLRPGRLPGFGFAGWTRVRVLRAGAVSQIHGGVDDRRVVDRRNIHLVKNVMRVG